METPTLTRHCHYVHWFGDGGSPLTTRAQPFMVWPPGNELYYHKMCLRYIREWMTWVRAATSLSSSVFRCVSCPLQYQAHLAISQGLKTRDRSGSTLTMSVEASGSISSLQIKCFGNEVLGVVTVTMEHTPQSR
jgi:hypothetical protein